MNRTAAGLAAYGRNGDSTLVHMSPGEVSGLQAFAKANGTTLTVNPHTGLHEAFNLKALLPAAAGLALSPFVGPLAAGLIVGGVHGAATGFENPLQSAMAGFGAYGGAGLGSAMGLGGATAASAAPVAGTGLTTTTGSGLGFQAANAGQNTLLAPELTSVAGSMPTPAAAASSYDLLSPQITGTSATGAGLPSLTAGSSSGLGLQAANASPNALMPTSLTGGATGIPTAAANAGAGQMGVGRSAMMAAAPVISDAMEPEQMGGTKPISTIRPYSFNREVTPGAFDDLTDSRERRYFNDQFTAGEPYQLAKGGLATFARGGKAKKPDPLEQRYDMADFRDPQSMQKKTMGMYQYAAGRTVRGPGDGMSDDVKANIDGVQEARLSDGEFVIPADVVSGLGNGSTEAGSKHLKEMMARVRKSRTGKTRQAPQIKVKGLMPA